MEHDRSSDTVVHGLHGPDLILGDFDLLTVATVHTQRVHVVRKDEGGSGFVEHLTNVADGVPDDSASLGELQADSLGPNSVKGVGVAVLIVGAETHRISGDAHCHTPNGRAEPPNQNPILAGDDEVG